MNKKQNVQDFQKEELQKETPNTIVLFLDKFIQFTVVFALYWVFFRFLFQTVEIVGNLAWRCYPVKVKFPTIIPNTPNDHLIGALNIRIKSEQERYDYSECGPGLNGTFGGDFSGPYKYCSPWFIDDFTSKIRTTMLTITDAYGSLYGSWGIGNELILDFKPSKGELFIHANHFVKQDGVVVYHINEMIILGSYHANCENYGHFFMDNLAPLMVVPLKIFDRIYVIYSDLKSYVYEGFRAVGLREDQLLLLQENEWFHADKLYAFVDGRPFSTFSGICFKRMRDKLANYYDTNGIIPTDYGLTNRKPGWRHMSNFDEIVQAYKTNFPEIDWKITPDLIPTMNETAHILAKHRLFFVIYGAGANRAIFMHKGTVVCLGATECFDYSNLKIIVGSEHFLYIWPSGLHQWEQGKNVSIDVTVNAMRECLKCDKIKKWQR